MIKAGNSHPNFENRAQLSHRRQCAPQEPGRLSGATKRIPGRSVLCLALFSIAVSGLRADPPENANAWTTAPHGWHLNQLGPRTVPVDPANFGGVIHVSAAGVAENTPDGSSTSPYRNLARAFDHAIARGTESGPLAILVAEGEYKDGTIAMVPGVNLFGGFDPETWERNIHLHPTVLDGGEKNRVLIGANDATIDGFVITGGQVQGHGAGIFCDQASPDITNNTFVGNHTVEPADYSHDPDRRRQRGHDGGAIGLVNYSNPVIHHNLFIGNTTGVGYGAAISARDDCIPQIGYNVFWENVCGTADHSITRSSNGGAIGLLNSSRAGIFHNLFVGNEAQGGSDGGAIFCEYFSWPEIRWNVFLRNYAGDDGGALDSQKFSHPKIKYNLFFGNRVDGSGGAIHHDDAILELENNIFAYNEARSQAGAFGGSHGWIRAINNTAVFNRAHEGGGGAVHHYNMKNPYLKPILFRNNIFYGNEPDELFLESGGDVHYNIVQGDTGRAYGWYDMDPKFKPDEVRMEVVSSGSVEGYHQTVITVAMDEPLEAGSLAGRVLRTLSDDDPGSGSPAPDGETLEGAKTLTSEDGVTEYKPQYWAQQAEKWSLIVDNGADWVRIWGDLSFNSGDALEVVKTFHLSKDSPAINSGLYTDYAADDIDGQPRYTPTIDFGADEYVPEE